MKADLKMNLVSELNEPLSFDGLIKCFSKVKIDLQDKDVSDFITMDDETTAEYSESILYERLLYTINRCCYLFLKHFHFLSKFSLHNNIIFCALWKTLMYIMQVFILF